MVVVLAFVLVDVINMAGAVVLVVVFVLVAVDVIKLTDSVVLVVVLRIELRVLKRPGIVADVLVVFRFVLMTM